MKFIDLTGQRFGRLTAVSRAANKGNATMWLCRCDCGNEKAISAHHLSSGVTQSCGCKRRGIDGYLREHSLPDTAKRLLLLWRGMKRRCYDSKTQYYAIYGGRGISVCDEWKDNFQAFYEWSMANGYKEEILPNGRNKWMIDRINNDGNYEPSNCRWVDIQIQANNKRSNHLLDFNGKIQTITKWSKETGLSTQVIKHRIEKLGWSIEKALTTPPDANRNRHRKTDRDKQCASSK